MYLELYSSTRQRVTAAATFLLLLTFYFHLCPFVYVIGKQRQRRNKNGNKNLCNIYCVVLGCVLCTCILVVKYENITPFTFLPRFILSGIRKFVLNVKWHNSHKFIRIPEDTYNQ